MYIPKNIINESLKNGKSLLEHLIDSKMEKKALYVLKNIKTTYDEKDNLFVCSLLYKCIFNDMEEVALEILKNV